MLVKPLFLPKKPPCQCDEESKQPKKASPRPPFRAIVGFALGITLTGSFGGLEPLFQQTLRQISSPPQSQTSDQSRLSSNQSRFNDASSSSQNIFSTEIKTRLKECIKANIIELSGIPTLSEFLASISWEVEPAGEFEYQLIQLYTRVQQLRAAIARCDPTLIQEILDAQEQVANTEAWAIIHNQASIEEDWTVIIPLADIRQGPGEEYFLLYQAPFGTLLKIDQEAAALLLNPSISDPFQYIIWLPVNLSNGSTGYVKNSDVRKIIKPL
jgi:hypothetical protein